MRICPDTIRYITLQKTTAVCLKAKAAFEETGQHSCLACKKILYLCQ